ncbi:MAG TPA: YaiO family outer membrane beta-barrel protein [Gemmatimonadaceae bacterium]|nr:YaiO family outer membrane beta-barrel protein [Gemmatimonadaceae bacterium]
MSNLRLLTVIATLCMWLASGAVPAAQGVAAAARARFNAGQAADAIALLQGHLATHPEDLDARVLLGNLFAWSKDYDNARNELSNVLVKKPAHGDAVTAMVNVELWSGRAAAAEAVARRALNTDPGRPELQAALAKALAARGAAWALTPHFSSDQFSNSASEWYESSITLRRELSSGPILVRASHADRFSLGDEQFEVEMYPRLGRGRYGYINVGFSPDSVLYPEYRVGADVFQSFGQGFEASLGYRRLMFDDAVNIYVPALSKYAGNYLFTARVFLTPDSLGTLSSLHLETRRYLTDGVSFVGLRYVHGSYREELRDVNDVGVLDSDGVTFEVSAVASSRLVVNVSGGFSHESTLDRADLRRYSLNGGLSVRF